MPKLPSYTERIYVDFSGDDGDPRKPGASRCICMAWLLSKEEDVYHNQGIVLSIKKIVGAHKTAELKYTSIKRHKQKSRALEALSHAKIQLLLIPVFKDRLSKQELKDPRTKRLIRLIHEFPLTLFLEEFQKSKREGYFQLVFDEIGWAGCQEGIIKFFRGNLKADWGRVRPDWLRFAKSGSNLMLQLADLLAGLGHEYVEGLKDKKLPPCSVCWIKGKSRCRPLPKTNLHLLRIIYPLLIKNDDGLAWEKGFIARPPAVRQDYMFVDCLCSPALQRRRSSG